VLFQILLAFALAFAQQDIGGAEAAVLLLRAVKREHFVQLRQPGIHAAFQHRRGFAPLALAVGDQGTAYIRLQAVPHKLVQGAAGHFHGVVVQIQARIHGVLAQAEIAVDAVLYAVAFEFDRVKGFYRLDKLVTQRVELPVGLSGESKI